MRFNSVAFICFFLPVCWSVWRSLCAARLARPAIVWLSLASLVFYSYWNWHYTPLLLLSLGINFILGRALIRRPRKSILVIGLIWNLGLLGYFKYCNFFVANLDALTGWAWPIRQIILPLGISFFTFQKVAFLVDAWRGKVSAIRPFDFSLFVLFFPQLIAGPIVHHRDFIPQLRSGEFLRFDQRRFLLGGLLFTVGLFNKTVIADTLAPVADSAFGYAALGIHLRFFEAWCGVFAYGLQLFYDFAGYSYMAMGLALLFGLKLPVNFFAPYTARNIIEFWRRWHITLSSFLRDYVYIPLGGSKAGWTVEVRNLLCTFLLAGLWHGAGWTFVLWGGWHGLALVINHAWRRRRTRRDEPSSWWSYALTFLWVQVGWVLFRSSDLNAAWQLSQSLVGVDGVSVPIALTRWVDWLAPVVRPQGLFPLIYATPSALLVMGLSAWAAFRGPSLLGWLGITKNDTVASSPLIVNGLSSREQMPNWRQLTTGSVMISLAFAALSRSSPFLYFQF